MNILGAFKKALVWPEEIKKKRKKNGKKIPTVLTSEGWQADHMEIQKGKEEKEKEKQGKRRQREHTKLIKEKEKEAKKVAAGEANKIDVEIKKLILQKKKCK